MSRPRDSESFGARPRMRAHARFRWKVGVTNRTALELLNEDLEETLWAQGYVPLYDFSWALRGLGLGLSETEIGALCAVAYRAFRAHHDLVLHWVDWPMDPGTFRVADESTPPDFDLHSTGTVRSPLLVLVSAKS